MVKTIASLSVKHKLPVSLQHILNDIVIRLTLLNHFVGLSLQVPGQVGIGICQVLILADQASQFLDYFLIKIPLPGSLELDYVHLGQNRGWKAEKPQQ
jgi:hypothetical protein